MLSARVGGTILVATALWALPVSAPAQGRDPAPLFAQQGTQDPGGTVFELPDAQATNPAPFQPVEPTRPLPAPQAPEAPAVLPEAPQPPAPAQAPAAQETAPTGEPARDTQEQPAAAPAGPAPAAAAPVTSAEREPHGDWALECHAEAPEGPSCQIVHQVVSGDGGQTVLVLALAESASGEGADLQLALPLGFAVPPGVRIEVGSLYQGAVPVSRCTAQGCLVEGRASAELLNAMRKGDTAIVSVQTVEDTAIRLPISLNGFTAAFDAMEAWD